MKFGSDLYRPAFYGGGEDDGGGCYAVGGEFVDDLLEVFDGGDGDLHYEAVAAGAAVAFEHFARALGDIFFGIGLGAIAISHAATFSTRLYTVSLSTASKPAFWIMVMISALVIFTSPSAA